MASTITKAHVKQWIKDGRFRSRSTEDLRRMNQYESGPIHDPDLVAYLWKWADQTTPIPAAIWLVNDYPDPDPVHTAIYVTDPGIPDLWRPVWINPDYVTPVVFRASRSDKFDWFVWDLASYENYDCHPSGWGSLLYHADLPAVFTSARWDYLRQSRPMKDPDRKARIWSALENSPIVLLAEFKRDSPFFHDLRSASLAMNEAED